MFRVRNFCIFSETICPQIKHFFTWNCHSNDFFLGREDANNSHSNETESRIIITEHVRKCCFHQIDLNCVFPLILPQTVAAIMMFCLFFALFFFSPFVEHLRIRSVFYLTNFLEMSQLELLLVTIIECVQIKC